jgi:hypothetical protein
LFLAYPPLLLCSCVLLLPERRHLLLCHLPLTDMAPGRGAACVSCLCLSLRALRCVAHCPHSATAISLGFGCLAAFLPLSLYGLTVAWGREKAALCTAPHPHPLTYCTVQLGHCAWALSHAEPTRQWPMQYCRGSPSHLHCVCMFFLASRLFHV